jgi:aromatic ring-opening dioxygenase catalytic subunit (LigB family)
MHYALGEAVSRLRAEGVVIVCSGMAVHNLRFLYPPPPCVDHHEC